MTSAIAKNTSYVSVCFCACVCVHVCVCDIYVFYFSKFWNLLLFYFLPFFIKFSSWQQSSDVTIVLMMCFMGQLCVLLQPFSILLAFVIGLTFFFLDEQCINFRYMETYEEENKSGPCPYDLYFPYILFYLWPLITLIHPSNVLLSPSYKIWVECSPLCLSPSCVTSPYLSDISLNLSVSTLHCMHEGPYLFSNYKLKLSCFCSDSFLDPWAS